MAVALTEQDMQDIYRDIREATKATAYVTPYGVALKMPDGKWVDVMRDLDLANPDGTPNETFGTKAAQ